MVFANFALVTGWQGSGCRLACQSKGSQLPVAGNKPVKFNGLIVVYDY